MTWEMEKDCEAKGEACLNACKNGPEGRETGSVNERGDGWVSDVLEKGIKGWGHTVHWWQVAFMGGGTFFLW